MTSEKPRRCMYKELDVVRVSRLVEPSRNYSSSPGVGRPPRVGDRAAIVYAYSTEAFALECVDSDGLTVWLADFSADELSPDESDDLMASKLHIVFRRSGPITLTKKAYSDWRKIQDDYDDYMASLGPWSVDEVIGYLRFEYSWFGEAEAELVRDFCGEGNRNHRNRRLRQLPAILD